MLPEPSSAVTVRPKGAFAVTLAGGVRRDHELGGGDGLLRRPGGVLGGAGEQRRDLGQRHRPILDLGHPGVDPGGVADAGEEGVVIAVDRPLGRFGRADETGRDRTPARPGSEELGPGVDPRRIARAAEDVLVERLHEVAVSDVLGAVLGRGEERCRDLPPRSCPPGAWPPRMRPPPDRRRGRDRSGNRTRPHRSCTRVTGRTDQRPERALARLELRVPVGQPGRVGVPPEDVAIQALDDGVPAASERSGARCRRQNGTLGLEPEIRRGRVRVDHHCGRGGRVVAGIGHHPQGGSGVHAGDHVVPRGVGDRRRVAGVQDPVVVKVDEHGAVGQPRVVRRDRAGDVEIVEDRAADCRKDQAALQGLQARTGGPLAARGLRPSGTLVLGHCTS